ncbi:MAG: transglycosylase domain-containing protein [Actinocatenispora sp.]
MALLAFPAVGLTGLVAKSGTDTFVNMPGKLKTPPPAQNSHLYAKDGKTLLTTFYTDNRIPVSIKKVAPIMQRAIVAAEDTRFYHHNGVDPRGIIRSLIANRQAGQVQQGASTLTMQYVRNVLIYGAKTPEDLQEATAETAQRKLREIRYAMDLERRYTKAQILGRYLNIVFFGHGAYGIKAAAQSYFSTTPDKLTLDQAAMLAGVVKSPNSFDPTRGSDGRKAALARRTYVLDSMVKLHFVSKETAAKAKSAPLGLKPGSVPNGCTEVPKKHLGWGFYCDYFVQWWDQQKAFGANSAEREYRLKTGGYKIITPFDPAVQQTAEDQSEAVYPKNNPKALPIAAVEPGTGHVVALAVNRDYSLARNADRTLNYPNTVDQLVAGGGDITGYQTGSTFKMFTMLAALKTGLPLSTSFDAPGQLQTNYVTQNGYYAPVNDNPSWMDGNRSMWTGYGRSVNTFFVWLEQKIGAQKAVAMAQRLGIKFRAQSDAELAKPKRARYWGPFTLGVTDTPPLDLANAYATVAAEGMYCKPLPALKITDALGHESSAAEPDCHRAVSKDIARAATDAARCPVESKSFFNKCDGGTAPDVGNLLGARAVAGKTGSSENNATESFVGFTPQIAAAGTACNPDNPSDAVGAGVSESVDVAVAKTMLAYLKGKPVRNFNRPSNRVAFGN